ncbi:MAG: hypothetical protein A3F14_06505 [Gammaproteobacteria bacterium RIFCSPHIGHO2_12_FULL_43_28]|nr:MAG: hypothetical protein A3F14_06505 [Gammaproteobacteria bacterium RIFCSPHIGHO2_12_FULL_43_28]
MVNSIRKYTNTFYQQHKWDRGLLMTLLLALIVSVTLFTLSGCASSTVSRNVAGNFDVSKQSSRNLIEDITGTTIADTYQNTSQRTKGVILGGTAGAVTGSLVSGLGVLPGAVTGLLLGASYGSYIDSHTTLKDRLINRGANVIVLGDQILIVIPSERIFYPMTSTIKPQAYSTLKLAAQYINRYIKMLVNVAVYTDSSGSSESDYELSQQQAQAVTKALSSNGIDARVLYAIGQGCSRLIDTSSLDWYGNDNYRVEITLEKLYV